MEEFVSVSAEDVKEYLFTHLTEAGYATTKRELIDLTNIFFLMLADFVGMEEDEDEDDFY